MGTGGKPLLRRASEGDTLTLRWNRDRLIPCAPQDTVSSALLRAGVLSTSRSIKLRRRRGPYCLRGDCGTCLVRIDGQPNQRACLTTVRAGMHVESQNELGPGTPDPTTLVDKMFADGMDHHHFMVRPRVVNQMMQSVARNLAGLGRLPEGPIPTDQTRQTHEVDVLVIGAGSAGAAVIDRLASTGARTLLVDRGSPLDLPHIDSVRADVLLHTGVFGIYPSEGKIAATTNVVGEPHVLHVIRARHVVLATGSRDGMLPFSGNDLPGVVAARGFVTMLERSGCEPAGAGVVVGPQSAEAWAGRLGVPRIDPGSIVTVQGRNRVTGLRLHDRTIECSYVAVAAEPAPAFELAKQAGLAVAWNGAGFAVQRDEHGYCGRVEDMHVWAVGGVTGLREPERSVRDGQAVGLTLIDALRREGVV